MPLAGVPSDGRVCAHACVCVRPSLRGTRVSSNPSAAVSSEPVVLGSPVPAALSQAAPGRGRPPAPRPADLLRELLAARPSGLPGPLRADRGEVGLAATSQQDAEGAEGASQPLWDLPQGRARDGAHTSHTTLDNSALWWPVPPQWGLPRRILTLNPET